MVTVSILKLLHRTVGKFGESFNLAIRRIRGKCQIKTLANNACCIIAQCVCVRLAKFKICQYVSLKLMFVKFSRYTVLFFRQWNTILATVRLCILNHSHSDRTYSAAAVTAFTPSSMTAALCTHSLD